MTTLYGAAQAGIAEYTAKHPQYYLMAGGKFLHQSGLCLQDGRKYAWQGSIEQARNCRRQFDAAAGCRAISVAGFTPTRQTVED